MANWKEVKEILGEAVLLHGAERQTFVENAVITDDVRSEVLSLLSFELSAEGLMPVPAIEFSKEFVSDSVEQNSDHRAINRRVQDRPRTRSWRNGVGLSG